MTSFQRRRLAVLVSLFAFSWALRGALFGAPKTRIYSHDAKGLQKEFEPFLKVVANGDPEKLRESFDVFALPEPATWFGQYFAKDQVQQLVWDNEAEVDGYRNSLTMILRRFLRGSSYSVNCKLQSDNSTTLQPRADAIQPLVSVPTEQYSMEFVSADGHRMSQLSNFAYVDGAFRYLGRGAYPFWSMPDATRKTSR